MPYYRDKLLSAWGNDRICTIGKPPAAIDPDILKNARRGPGGIGLIVANPHKALRHQVDSSASADSNGDSHMGPKYLSDKSRTSANVFDKPGNIATVATLFSNLGLTNSTGDLPPAYADLRIRYGGPRGVQDFDFG